jgi:hypothetical protein
VHANPVKRGLVAEPEQWRGIGYRSYVFGEEGAVKLNQQSEINIKSLTQAA